MSSTRNKINLTAISSDEYYDGSGLDWNKMNWQKLHSKNKRISNKDKITFLKFQWILQCTIHRIKRKIEKILSYFATHYEEDNDDMY